MLSMEGMLLIRAITGGGWLKFYNYRNKKLQFQEPKRLIKRQFPDVPIEIIHGTAGVTVTKCFDNKSKVGNRMLDFLAVVLNFRNSRPPDEVEDCLRYFRDECCYVKAN